MAPMISDDTLRMIHQFSADRDWQQFHAPANMAKSVSIEAGELLECFQWSDELIRSKMAKNAKKYPVEASRGSSAKAE